MVKLNTNQAKNQNENILEQAAEAWVRLCLYSIKQKKQLVNQNQDKKAYEYSK